MPANKQTEGAVNHYRQGDVLVIAVESIPAKAQSVPAENGRVILAYGEATGHHHSIAVAEADVELFSVADEVDRYLRVRSRAAQLTHQEHAAVTLPAGDYLVRRQREYSPAELRMVAD